MPRLILFLIAIVLFVAILFFIVLTIGTTVQLSNYCPNDFANSQVSTYQRRNKMDLETLVFDPTQNAKLKQNDPIILEFILKNHLLPPFPVPYNLANLKGDPAAKEKQHWTILKLLKNKTNGIFVEAGANDGEYLSTTLVLERDFGWTGLLIEPDYKAYSELQRKGRKSWISNACLSLQLVPTKAKFVHHRKYSVISKLSHKEDGNSNDRFWKKSEKEERDVKCFPLYSLISALNMTVIDYLSLDIEGAEVSVLETFPFESVLVRTMTVEFDYIQTMPGADARLKSLLADHGYVLVTSLTGGHANDYVFAHHSVLSN